MENCDDCEDQKKALEQQFEQDKLEFEDPADASDTSDDLNEDVDDDSNEVEDEDNDD